MLRVIELNPDFFYGSAHLFLMAYYGSRSPMMGGNPEAAKMHYEKLKAMSKDQFLLADLYYARYLLYQQQEKEAFENIVRRIADWTSTEKQHAMLNRVAANRARVYLNAIDELF